MAEYELKVFLASAFGEANVPPTTLAGQSATTNDVGSQWELKTGLFCGRSTANDRFLHIRLALLELSFKCIEIFWWSSWHVDIRGSRSANV